MSEPSEKDLRIEVYYEGEWRGIIHPDPDRHRYVAWIHLRDGGSFCFAGHAPLIVEVVLGYGRSHVEAIQNALAEFHRCVQATRDQNQ